MAKPAPKGNFFQTLLIVMILYLGITLFMQSQKQPDTRTAEQYMSAVRNEVADLKSESTRRGVSVETLLLEKVGSRQTVQLQLRSEAINVEQSLEVLRYLNELGMDLTAAQYLQFHEGKIAQQAKKENWDERRRREAEIEAKLLVADVQYRQGLARRNNNRQDLAFITLQGTNHQNQGKPAWTQSEFQLPAPVNTGASPRGVSGQEFFTEMVGKLSARSKTDLVLGFIPGYQVIDALVGLTGRVPSISYAFAALLLAALVRGIVWPLAQKQYMFGRQMSQLQPLVKEIKERFTDKKTGQITDPQDFQKKTMDLYREYGINPFAGCLPTMIQIPFFLVIYQCMVAYRFEFQNGTFLWISPSAAAATNGFIAPNLGERDYILISLYAISMVVTTLLTPVSDPTNAKQQRLMGIGIAVFFSIMMFFWPLPSAFVLYWVFTNVFATVQMLRTYRMPPPPLVKVNAPGGGVLPVDVPRTNGSVASKGTPVKHRPKRKK
jgi:YidC/Oxa1 family membrane protein insertase